MYTDWLADLQRIHGSRFTGRPTKSYSYSIGKYTGKTQYYVENKHTKRQVFLQGQKRMRKM